MTDDPKQDQLPGMNRSEPKPPKPRTPEELKRDGMRRAAEHAGDDWIAQALNVIHACAKKYRYFFYDHYQRAAELTHLPKPPGNGRAWGPVISIAKRNGWIVPTGDMEKSRRPVCHGAPKPVYRSTIHPKAE